MFGYQNNVLRIDLTAQNVSKEPLNMEWAKKYIGGKGLGIRYLYEELKPGTDPLSPENKLIFMTAPLTGTVVPNSGKLAIISRSPATGTILDCSIGGHIAIGIKYAGYDAVILEGAFKEPGYLYIEDDKIEFLSANDLWGKGSHETETLLIKKHGRDCSIMSIGPAGENLLPMACINSDYYRQAGRGGIGSVMGSKNLKAVVVKGSGSVKVADMENALTRIHEILREDTVTEDNLWAYTDGSATLVETCDAGGVLPDKNFQDAAFKKSETFNAEKVIESRKGKKGCGSCALGCGNFLKMNDAVVEGPEYETLSLCGSNCGIYDLKAIVKFNQLCDDFGMDTMSTGLTISWAMEMTEKGIKDFGICFGDIEGYLQLPEKIARKIGVGAELALGTKKLSEKYGGKDFAMQCKGLEFAGYEPRGSWGMGLAYAVSDRGACHMRSYPIASEVYEGTVHPYTGEGKAKLVYEGQIYNASKFSSIICDFWALGLDTVAELLTIVTGETFTESDMEVIGDRIINLAKAFNQREGFDKKDDTLPKRIFNEALKSGAAAGQRIPKETFEKMLSEYYEVMGWEQDGTISPERLKELAL
jgi:aldehyde:ferredoxin oxidoreductase